ncbi:DUF11 domain-containing protein [Patescibacteria group bacterium]|nr:DUF11 domain-containing protein [Patescibacteria group bacterium]
MAKGYRVLILLLSGLIAGTLGYIFSTKAALAQYYAISPQNASLMVEKKVRSLSMDQYYHNIAASTYTFQEDSLIEFQILVKNNGNVDVNNINVRDFLPHHLSLLFYPGSLNGQEIDWNIDHLSPNESKVFVIRAKVKIDANPIGKQINKATATSNNLSDTDTATYYIGKPTVPVTGDDSLLIKSVVMITFIGSGVTLRKLARGY